MPTKALVKRFGVDSEATNVGLQNTFHRVTDTQVYTGARRKLVAYLPEGEVAVMQARLGWTFDFTLTNPTGRYTIQLHDPVHRQILRKLIEHSNDLRRRRIEQGWWSRQQYAGFP